MRGPVIFSRLTPYNLYLHRFQNCPHQERDSITVRCHSRFPPSLHMSSPRTCCLSQEVSYLLSVSIFSILDHSPLLSNCNHASLANIFPSLCPLTSQGLSQHPKTQSPCSSLRCPHDLPHVLLFSAFPTVCHPGFQAHSLRDLGSNHISPAPSGR